MAQSERHPLTSAFLKRCPVGVHGLLKAFCSGFPFSQGRQDITEVALRHGPIGAAPAHECTFLKRCPVGVHGLLKVALFRLPVFA